MFVTSPTASDVVTVSGTGNVTSANSIGILLYAPGPSSLTVAAGGFVSGVVGVDASAHSDLQTNPNLNGAGVTGGLVLTNAGTIVGTGGTAIQFGSGDDTLALQTGSVITGNVDGGAGNNTITLNGTTATQTATRSRSAATRTSSCST